MNKSLKATVVGFPIFREEPKFHSSNGLLSHFAFHRFNTTHTDTQTHTRTLTHPPGRLPPGGQSSVTVACKAAQRKASVKRRLIRRSERMK